MFMSLPKLLACNGLTVGIIFGIRLWQVSGAAYDKHMVLLKHCDRQVQYSIYDVGSKR